MEHEESSSITHCRDLSCGDVESMKLRVWLRQEDAVRHCEEFVGEDDNFVYYLLNCDTPLETECHPDSWHFSAIEVASKDLAARGRYTLLEIPDSVWAAICARRLLG